MTTNHEAYSTTTAPMDFCCRDRPKGMKDYVFDDITSHQQRSLNQHKIEMVRSNQKYLAAHPEVRAMVALIMRTFMREKPKRNFHETIAVKLFLEPQIDLRREIEEYLTERQEVWGVNSTQLLFESNLRRHMVARTREHHAGKKQARDKKEELETREVGVGTSDGRTLIRDVVRSVLTEILDRVQAIEDKKDEEIETDVTYFDSLAAAGFMTEIDDDVDLMSLSASSITSILERTKREKKQERKQEKKEHSSSSSSSSDSDEET